MAEELGAAFGRTDPDGLVRDVLLAGEAAWPHIDEPSAIQEIVRHAQSILLMNHLETMLDSRPVQLVDLIRFDPEYLYQRAVVARLLGLRRELYKLDKDDRAAFERVLRGLVKFSTKGGRNRRRPSHAPLLRRQYLAIRGELEKPSGPWVDSAMLPPRTQEEYDLSAILSSPRVDKFDSTRLRAHGHYWVSRPWFPPRDNFKPRTDGRGQLEHQVVCRREDDGTLRQLSGLEKVVAVIFPEADLEKKKYALTAPDDDGSYQRLKDSWDDILLAYEVGRFGDVAAALVGCYYRMEPRTASDFATNLERLKSTFSPGVREKDDRRDWRYADELLESHKGPISFPSCESASWVTAEEMSAVMAFPTAPLPRPAPRKKRRPHSRRPTG